MTPHDLVELLEDLKEEEELPRATQEKVSEIIFVLKEDIDLELRVDRVRSILDELEEHQLPSHVRTQLWHVAAALEML